MKLRIAFVLALSFVFLFAGSAVWSQTVQGVITGTVTDPSGAVVPNATVTITNAGTNIAQTTTTGDDGSYRFPLVPPGTYTLDVKVANFAERKASGLVVQASQTVPYNVRLELAGASQVIEVTSQAPLVQTATSDLGFQVDSATIQNAALVDRDVFGVLPFLAPQVSPGLDGSPTSGGARESGTSYLLNGADDNNNFSEGAINTSPLLESIEDFAIITNSMSAQYGRGAGAVVTANQKSGTNQFHGALYEQNRNATLNANDFFYNRAYGASVKAHQADPTNPILPTKPKYIKNQFGGAIGGPIKKDKSFFFFTMERLNQIEGSTSANNFAPTTAAIAFVKAHGSPLAQQMLSAYAPATSDATCGKSIDPTQTVTGAGTQANGLPNEVGCLSFSDPVTTTQSSYYGRFDENFSTSDRLSFTANVRRLSVVDKFGGGGLLANGGNIPATSLLNSHNLAVIETHSFNSRVFNELNLTQTRFYNPFIEGNPSTQRAPEIIVDNLASGCLGFVMGPYEGGQIQSFVQDRYVLQDNLTWSKGRHAFKIGASGNYGILYRNWDLGQPGYYEFADTTNVTGTCPTTCAVITAASDGALQSNGTITNVNYSNSNFAGDYPYYQEISVNPSTGTRANAYRHYTYHDYAAFFQDDWKITAHLTLNLGMRWERYGAPTEDHGIMAQFVNLGCNILTPACISAARVGPAPAMWKTRNKDFGPRVGFAWDPTGKGKMAVRGGFGINYDRIFDNIWSNGAWNPPFYALVDLAGCSGDTLFYASPANIAPGAFHVTRVSVRTMDVNLKDSSAQNFYLGVERQFFGGLLLRANYQGSMGRHLPMLENYNRADGIGANASLSPVRPNSLYSGFNYRSNSVSSNYNALVLEAQKRMGRGLQFQTGFTWSKLLDVNSELFAGCSTIGAQTAPYYYISNAYPNLSYGKSAQDHKYAFKFNVTYEVPFLKAEKGLVGHALGGWSMGSFFQLYTGHPIDVYNGRASRTRARDVNGALVLDANGLPINIGGDYNLDGVLNDHPNFIGSNINNVYSHGSPADGIFIDNNPIGCGGAWVPANVANVAACNTADGVTTPSTLFGNPGYPASGPTYLRFGNLGRDVFHGPKFVDMDFGLKKTFNLTERFNLKFSADAQNLFNHPNFDGVTANVASAKFGQAQYLVGSAASRVMSLSLRLGF